MDSELHKTEVKTLEELVQLLQSTSIKPKPDVEHVEFIWNFRDYIEDHLNVLKNHSFYNAFKITKESIDGSKESAKLRVKRMPQDTEWFPPTGRA